MKPPFCLHKIGSYMMYLVFITVLLAAACQPIQPPPARPTSIKEPAASPTAQDSGLLAEDQGDPLAPRVVEIQPPAGQELPLSGEITLRFDQEMDVVKTGAAWKFTGSDQQEINGEITWPDTRSMRFKPGTPLAADSAYLGTLATGAASSQGTPLGEPVMVDFDTISPLQDSQVFPPDGSADIPSEAVITAIFNRPVVPLVAAADRDQLPDPLEIKPAVSGRGEWVSTSVYAFQPGKPLKGGIPYEVTIKADTSDAAGETFLEDDFSWEFTTIAPSIQSFMLSNGSANTEPGLKDVLLDEYFSVNLNQPMDVDSSQASL